MEVRGLGNWEGKWVRTRYNVELKGGKEKRQKGGQLLVYKIPPILGTKIMLAIRRSLYG